MRLCTYSSGWKWKPSWGRSGQVRYFLWGRYEFQWLAR